jgi:hypothetical protein
MARANPDNSITTPPQPPTSQERGDELLMRWRLARAAGVPADLRLKDVRCECLMCLAEGENSPHWLRPPPRAESVDSFSQQSRTTQPESETLTSESRKPSGAYPAVKHPTSKPLAIPNADCLNRA